MAGRLSRLLGVLALVAASVALTLGVFELVLRWRGYEAIYQVYSHPELFWQRDALLGWSHAPRSRGTYKGPRPWPIEFEAPVEINSLGLRGPELEELPEDGYRVLVLGDSLVAAFEVPYEQTFEALLEQQLQRRFDFPVQVINAGVRGYGTDQSYLYYRERGRELDPDLVIFVHGANDAGDNITLHRMRRTFSKGALALRDGGSLDPVGYPIPEHPLCSEYALDASFAPERVDTGLESAFCNVQTRLADRSALFTFFSERIRQNPGLLVFLYRLGTPSAGVESEPRSAAAADAGEAARARSRLAPRYALTEAILRALAREVRADGAALLLPVVPSYWPPLDPGAFDDEGVLRVEVRVDLGLPQYHFDRDSHMNAPGHAVFAQELAPAIEARIRADRSTQAAGIGARAAR